ncbi:hypothetical protein KM043_013748 [Ampulex compressa]|nr:hypothetical protein KM043_013748 [Ampulex compressa]
MQSSYRRFVTLAYLMGKRNSRDEADGGAIRKCETVAREGQEIVCHVINLRLGRGRADKGESCGIAHVFIKNERNTAKRGVEVQKENTTRPWSSLDFPTYRKSAREPGPAIPFAYLCRFAGKCGREMLPFEKRKELPICRTVNLTLRSRLWP